MNSFVISRFKYGVFRQSTRARPTRARRFVDAAMSILTNDLYGDPNIRRRQTEAPEQLQ